MCIHVQKSFVSVDHVARKNEGGWDESIVGGKNLPRKRLLNMRVTTSEVLVMSFPLAKVSFTAREYRCTASYTNDAYHEGYK